MVEHITLGHDRDSKQNNPVSRLAAEASDGSSQTITGDLRLRIENRLEELLETSDYSPPNLAAAMCHAVLDGGKRFHSLLFVLMVPDERLRRMAIDVACAIEMMHAASLILDDLPSMNDAALRSGKPTTHAVFGEATAILAGISLLACGMNILATIEGLAGEVRASLAASLSLAAGATGVSAGQEVDLVDVQSPDVDDKRKNWLKTVACS